MRTLLIGSQKGGVGKTSLAASVGALAARAEPHRRVLLVDGDQQANLSRRNLGMDGDKGRNLYGCVVLGESLRPIRDVRPGLDVVPGGPSLAMVGGAAAAAAAAGVDLAANVRAGLDSIAAAQEYSLCIVDLGPGDVALLDAFLGAVQFVVAPHREDEADLDGVELLIKRVLRANRDLNPGLTFLGPVAFGRDPRATARNAALDRTVLQMLAGSGVEPFTATIRHSPAAARDVRGLSLTPRELIRQAEQSSTERVRRLKTRTKSTEGVTTWSRPEAAEALARDYLALLKEILQRCTAHESKAIA